MQCITVSYGRVQGRAKQYLYFQPALYETQERKRDGVLVWKYSHHLGTARRSYRLAVEDAQQLAAESGLPLIGGVRQWRLVEGAN